MREEFDKMRENFLISDVNKYSLEEKLDILLSMVEETENFWDDDAAVVYREKMFSLIKEINNLLKDKVENA